MAVCKSLLASPEEGHDLRSGAICVGAECRVGGSLGDVLLDCPQNCVGIVGIGGNIRERIATARHGGLLIWSQRNRRVSDGNFYAFRTALWRG